MIRWLFVAILGCVCLGNSSAYGLPQTTRQSDTPTVDIPSGLRHRKKATQFHLNNDFEQAVKEYTIAISLGVNSAAVFANRGSAFASMRKFDEAIKDYDEAIKRGLETRVYAARAHMHMMKNAFQLATRDYTTAIENGDAPELVFDRGRAYWKLNDTQAALRDFSEAIKILPTESEFYYYRGGLYFNSLRDHQRAISDFDQAIRFNPKSIEPVLAKAYVCLMLGRTKDYEALMVRAESINPKDVRIHFRKGVVSLKRNETDAAIGYLNKALKYEKYQEHAPHESLEEVYIQRGRIFCYLGHAYLRKGDQPKALAYLTRAVTDLSVAIKLQPYDPVSYEIRSNAYRALGKNIEAKADEAKANEFRARILEGSHNLPASMVAPPLANNEYWQRDKGDNQSRPAPKLPPNH